MGFVDLHVHSNVSDGTLSPSEVVSLAVESGLYAIALTDHDTIDGIAEAQRAAEGTSLEVIPGIELSCVYTPFSCSQGKEEEIHILGLYVDYEDSHFVQSIQELLAIREQRNDEMICRFCAGGMEMTRDELTGGCPGAVITRAHFARVLLDKGFATSMDQAFKKYLTYGSPYCMKKERITPERAMELLTDCHAFPVLAHPCQYHLGDAGTEALVCYLKGLGLEGLEVYHSSNNQYESGKLKKLAVKYGLLPTGGSDFHGTNKPDIKLGIGRGRLRISSLLLDDIKNFRKTR